VIFVAIVNFPTGFAASAADAGAATAKATARPARSVRILLIPGRVPELL
jgi:hypothetical protein